MIKFKKIFGFRDETQSEIKVKAKIDKAQFVDESKPEVSYQTLEMKSEITPIAKLLQRNWQPIGYNDEYEFLMKHEKNLSSITK